MKSQTRATSFTKPVGIWTVIVSAATFVGAALGTPGAMAAVISNSTDVAVLDCAGRTISLGRLAAKSEARETLAGIQVTTTAGFRLDAKTPPDCLKELDFINVPLLDSSPPSWVDENGNTHALSAPYIDPPWKWNPGNVPQTDDKPFYDDNGQKRNLKASQAGGIAGPAFALDDLLKTATDADPTLALVFGDRPRISDSIKFATLLASVDAIAKKISVIESFTWGALVSREGGNVNVTTLPLVMFAGLPAGLDRVRLQSALDKSGFGADITAPNGTLQHKGEGWTVTAATDCTPCRPAPEPVTWALLLSGLIGMGLARRWHFGAPWRGVAA